MCYAEIKLIFALDCSCVNLLSSSVNDIAFITEVLTDWQLYLISCVTALLITLLLYPDEDKVRSQLVVLFNRTVVAFSTASSV